MALTFDESKHEYCWDGRRVPSVTQVLRECGISDYGFLGEADRNIALDRGRRVHLACQFLSEGTLDWDSVDDNIAGYVRAFDKFMAEQDFQPEAMEEPFYSPFGYAGTRDLRGKFRDAPAVIDLKTGAGKPAYWVPIQLAAYVRPLPDAPKWKRITLQLHRDGEYLAVAYPPADFLRHWTVFQSALNVHVFKSERR